jgi:uncharacterized protein (DUF342 family)
MPSLSVTVSGDGMGAKIRIGGFTAEGWKAEWAGPDGPGGAAKLRSFLEAEGIAPECIREDVLDWMAEALASAPAAGFEETLASVQDADVAQGRAPVHDEPVGLMFHCSYLSDAGAVADLRRKADARGESGIRDAIDPRYWVGSGDTVLSFQDVAGGRDGSDVLGAPIPRLHIRDRLPPFGHSLFLNGRKLIAVCEGALIIEDGRLKVLGSDSLPTCQVVVAEDKMSADLVLGGNHLNDWDVTMEMARASLAELGVKCLLPEEDVRLALDRFNRDHLPATIPVARGRAPVAGENGRITLLIDPEPAIPEPAADGSIDFKDFSFFKTVDRGAKLAEVRPPTAGDPGMNVLGESIPAPPGRPFADKPGKNTVFDGSDPVYVIASVPGRFAMRAGVPEVVEVLQVQGDVSLKTGNIDFPGAVRISGDVNSRMEVRAVGDVEVAGTVEDCVIHSDGAIVIKGGVTGSGAGGLIKSRLSSVTISYLHNQRIESHSNIEVLNEIINSALLARKSIRMRYGKYSVLGGHLLAGEGMELFNVGSEAGNRTVLEVGKDFEVEAEMAAMNAALQQHADDLEFLRGMEEQLTGVIRLRRGSSDEDVLLQKRTQGGIEILERRIVSLRKDLAAAAKRLYHPGPCEVVLRGTAYPGTVLKYRESVIAVPKAMKNRRWIFRERAILPPPEGLPL